MFQDTTALKRIEAMSARINIIQGGARAGKTTAMVIHLCDLSFAVCDKIISVVSDTYPNLEKGVIRDWEKLLKRHNYERYFIQNKVKHTWTNKVTGTVVEFFSCEADDALGAGRDYLFINEAYRVPYAVFDQLMLRTEVMAWLDFNPINEFWVHTEVMAKRTDWQFEKLTYLDNEGLPPSILADLLQHKGDGTSNWWRVYGLGEIGALEGNVYQGWLRHDTYKGISMSLKRYGVDFGYNDPTTIMAICEDINPLNRILPDGDNDGGKGWQCSKYAGYLATGKRQYSIKNPDYGPVNGRDMVDYLIRTFGWVECKKQNGAIFSYNTGQYGHTGIVKDAKNNIVNDANWQPLRVGTHYLNLDAVGARYACPKSMVISTTNSVDKTPQTANTKPVVPVSKPVVSTGPNTGKTYVDKPLIYHKGEMVVPLRKIDYDGRHLRQYDDKYYVVQDVPEGCDRVVLGARGQIWAAMRAEDIKRV